MVKFGLENEYDLRANYLLALTKSLTATCKSLSIFPFYHIPSSILQGIELLGFFFLLFFRIIPNWASKSFQAKVYQANNQTMINHM